jgi:hypothetical protein
MIPERGGLVLHRRTPAALVRFTRAHEGPQAAEIKAAEREARAIVADRRVVLRKDTVTHG